jgi:hypothetical protein
VQTGHGSVFELSFEDDGSDEHVLIKRKLRPSESPAQPFTAGSTVVWHGSVHPEAFAPPSRMRSAACGPERLRSHWDEWPKPLANAATRLLMPQATCREPAIARRAAGLHPSRLRTSCRIERSRIRSATSRPTRQILGISLTTNCVFERWNVGTATRPATGDRG